MSRLERVRDVMRDRSVDLLLVGPGADLRYLVGYDAPALERLTLLVVPASGAPSLVVPNLEAPRAAAAGLPSEVEVAGWGEREDPYRLVADRVAAGASARPDTVAVADRLWTAFTLRLQATLLAGTWVAGSEVLQWLRMRKEPAEVAALRAAARAIDAVHAAVPALLRPGRTEIDVSRDISDRILDEHDHVNFVIVAGGPNGASPHHEPGDRRLEAGDAVVVDIGGTRAGYCSDMTRNYTVGVAPSAYRELHDVLLAAQRAAVDAVRPGVAAESVDAAARELLASAGLGEAFVHRTGHGIGVEEHEHPYIIGGNAQPLEAGMAFSIEPGVYVPNRYGARIEDIVVVTDDGVERLNTLSRDLVEVTS